MDLVICLVTLWSGPYKHVVKVKAPAMHTDEEVWYVDLTDYIQKHAQFKKDNNFVQLVNSNDCLFAEKRK